MVNGVGFYWAEKPASWFDNFLDIARSVAGIDDPGETSSMPGVSKGETARVSIRCLSLDFLRPSYRLRDMHQYCITHNKDIEN